MPNEMQIGIGVCVSIGLIGFIMGLAWINSRPKGHERRPSIPNIPRPTPLPPISRCSDKANKAMQELKQAAEAYTTPTPLRPTLGATPSCVTTSAPVVDWRYEEFMAWTVHNSMSFATQGAAMQAAFYAGLDRGLALHYGRI